MAATSARRVIPLLFAAGFAVASTSTSSAVQSASGGITDVPGIRVGQVTLTERPTGCTVVLTPPDTVGAIDQRGGAPGTVETDLLRPENTVSVVHAVVLSGGSAFGLDTRTGVMKYLEEQKIGFPFGGAYVPIVTGAVLFDLPVGGKPGIRPDAACGYEAARTAKTGTIEEGSMGAGAGATVGKLAGFSRAMKGGIGTASIRLPDGTIIGVIVAVNPAGSVIDRRTGKPLAGVRTTDGRSLQDPFGFLRSATGTTDGQLQNTTIGVVATNAKLSKAQTLKVAQMAQDGYARSIFPSHMPNDGDTVFALATGALRSSADPDVGRIGALAAEMISDAIERAVLKAKGLPGFPSAIEIR